MKSIYCAVRTGALNTPVCASYLKGQIRNDNNKSKRQLVAHGDYSNLTYCRRYFEGYLKFFSAAFQNFYLSFPPFFAGAVNDVLRNHGWETMTYALTFLPGKELLHELTSNVNDK